MKIQKIEAIPVKLEAKPFKTSYGDFSDYHNVIVKVFCDNGHIGIGEASPWLPAELGETQRTVFHIINDYLAPLIIGKDPNEIDKIHYVMDRFVKGHVIAKAAIDIAIYDLLGKSYGISVGQLLGGVYREEFITAGAIGVKNADEMEADAKDWASRGYKAMKVKLPDITQEDPVKIGREKIGRVREAMGPDVTIIVDVNQGWQTAAVALRAIEALEEFDIYMEQPIPATDIDGLAYLTRKSRVPIIADEAIFTLAGALEVIKRGAAHIFNIKTTRPGGLWKARRLITLAEAAGIQIQIDDVAETRIATTASAQLASSVRDDHYFVYCGGPACAWLSRDLVKDGGVKIDNDGTCHLPNQPGLGLVIDEDYLEKSTVII
jgi:L-alanine-DL-glutamate epimerase-like enolase superfamily enzyme